MTDVDVSLDTFVPWPKTTRLFRDIVITEKLDGTNTAVRFDHEGNWAAQSRKKLLTLDADNYGVARWVFHNHEELFQLLGPGTHFGELWGHKIQGNRYNMAVRRFSLFNTAKWADVFADGPVNVGDTLVDTVPVLYQGPYSEEAVRDALTYLDVRGSTVAPGRKAEGVCVYHTQSRVVQKVTLDNEDKGKWEWESTTNSTT